MSYMSQQLMAAVRSMASIDFSTLPSVKFIGRLRVELIQKGLTPELAEKMAARVDVTMPPDALTDDEINELAQHYASFIENMMKAFSSVGVEDATSFVLNMSAPLTLKLE